MKKVFICAIILVCANLFSCTPEKIPDESSTFQTQGEEGEIKNDPNG
jgi:hypothetical protein